VTSFFASATSVKASPYFPANAFCAGQSSTLTPITRTPRAENSARCAWNPFDSIVQPGVSAFG
jgi:hypothetical protein